MSLSVRFGVRLTVASLRDSMNTDPFQMPFLCFKKFGSLTNGTSSRSSLERFYATDESMHLPLILDQYYYGARPESADKRVKKQVLFRHQEREANRIVEDERLICMVDQLWVHVFDDSRKFPIVTDQSA